MKTLYIECNMGAAGDMLCSALLELHSNPDAFMKKVNSIGIPTVMFTAEPMFKCAIAGTHMNVEIDGTNEEDFHHHHHENEHHHEHHHSALADIEHIISSLHVTESVKKNALEIYKLIAAAEAHAHRCEIEHIHFHEVGTLDAIADVVCACMLIEDIGADLILASPIHVGSGTVQCAHGILPVPAPATAYILQNVPTYGGSIKGELCTPTGAAILKHFVKEFTAMPVMKVEKIGYGMGSRDYETANCVRVMLGETQKGTDTIIELCCNVDDMTGEAIGYAVEKLMTAGALDVYTTAIGMKKNRPGVLISCMCKIEQRDEMRSLMFKHLTTIGIRENISKRYTLSRSEMVSKTNFGDVRVKTCEGYGVTKLKPEYDDLSRLADENDISLFDIKLLDK